MKIQNITSLLYALAGPAVSSKLEAYIYGQFPPKPHDLPALELQSTWHLDLEVTRAEKRVLLLITLSARPGPVVAGSPQIVPTFVPPTYCLPLRSRRVECKNADEHANRIGLHTTPQPPLLPLPCWGHLPSSRDKD